MGRQGTAILRVKALGGSTAGCTAGLQHGEGCSYEATGRLLADLPPLDLAILAKHISKRHSQTLLHSRRRAADGGDTEMRQPHFSDMKTKRNRADRAAFRVCCWVLAPGTSLADQEGRGKREVGA